jgi:hypothetical protein
VSLQCRASPLADDISHRSRELRARAGGAAQVAPSRDTAVRCPGETPAPRGIKLQWLPARQRSRGNGVCGIRLGPNPVLSASRDLLVRPPVTLLMCVNEAVAFCTLSPIDTVKRGVW